MTNSLHIKSIVVNTTTFSDFKEVVTACGQRVVEDYHAQNLNSGTIISSFVLSDRVTELDNRKCMKAVHEGFRNVHHPKATPASTAFVQAEFHDLSSGLRFLLKNRASIAQKYAEGPYYFCITSFIGFDKDEESDQLLQKLNGAAILFNF